MVVADLAALLAGFLAAFVIRAASPISVAFPMKVSTYLVVLLGLLPFWICIFALLGLYRTAIHERRFAEIGRLFIGSFTGLLFVVFWDYMSMDAIFPAKLVPIYGFVIAFLLLVTSRTLIRTIRSSLFRVGVGLSHLVVVGNSPITTELLDSLSARSSGYTILGVVGYRKATPENIPTYRNFAAFVASQPRDIHGIIQTEIYADEERNSEILDFAQERHVAYQFVPGNSELYVGNIDVDLFRNSIPVINVHQTALFGWGRVVKRLFDIAVGVFALILASPVMLLVALVVWASRSGSVFFSQTRLTRFDTKFKLYKFRTQYAKYDGTTPEEAFVLLGKPGLAKTYRDNGDFLDKDPRVTPIGKFLRTTSLDELPQLFNVVRGDLSLVGPRALIPQEIDKHQKKHTILSVKSGLTGLAVVSGRRDIPYEERRKLDVYYVQNWSFGMDIIILLKTVRMLLGRIGAR